MNRNRRHGQWCLLQMPKIKSIDIDREQSIFNMLTFLAHDGFMNNMNKFQWI